MALIITVILVALVFEFINGFHDTANSIATVVGTKVLSPPQAIVLAAVTNLVGALAGTAVGATAGKGLVDTARCRDGPRRSCGRHGRGRRRRKGLGDYWRRDP